MPRLVLFAACEKVIVDAQTYALSLTSVLQEITVTLVPGGPIPQSNAIAPMTWATATVFRSTPEDKGKTYEQKTAVRDAAGRTLIETNIAVFSMTIEYHNIVSNVLGMPIGDAGAKSIKCLLREKGQPEWKEVADFPIWVKWTTPPIVQ